MGQETVFSDVFQAIYSVINDNVADPLGFRSKWIFSSFPEEDIAEGSIKYPIIIIEPANMSWEKLTMTKAWNMIDITIEAYSTRMIEADSLLNKINISIDQHRAELKNDNNLHFINLDRTDTDFTLRGGTRAHIRIAMYKMQKPFVTGLAKGTLSKTITSSAELS